MNAVLADLNARFFALCRLHGITPPLDEHGDLTDEGWLGELVPEAGEERAVA